jgi:hypothetical protein
VSGARRCAFESSASSELIVRLSAYPKMRAALEVLPPKMLALSSSAPPTIIELRESRIETRVEEVTRLIERATFTGRGDKPMVVGLYEEYVGRIATSLQGTLALKEAGDAKQLTIVPPPQIAVPPAAPLRLATGQLLLVLPSGGARSAGGEDGARLGAIDATGRSVTLTLAGGDVVLSYDGCSQVVLPWKTPGNGWEVALMSDAEALRGSLTDGLGEVCGAAARLSDAASAAEVRKVGERAQRALDAVAQRVQTPAMREAVEAAVNRVKAAAAEAVAAVVAVVTSGGGEATVASKAAASLRALREVAARLLPAEALAAAALRATEAAGGRRYAPGQALTVRIDGAWCDAEVEAVEGGAHRVRLAGDAAAAADSLALHPWNHAPRELPAGDFEAVRGWWVASLRVQHAHIADALSGRRLDTLEQCVAIDVTGGGDGLAGGGDVHSMSRWLRALAPRDGAPTAAPIAALLTGPPAAGKTSLLSQMVLLTLDDADLVPVVVKVQKLQVWLLEQPDVFATAFNWIDGYLSLTEEPESYRMLRQAMAARRALILLDGLDEGGTVRERIERHVTEVIAPQV